MDPTQPVHVASQTYGGYYAWLGTNGLPNPLAPNNPLADLNDKRDISAVNRAISNVQLEYALPSLPELKAVVNAGGDIASGNGYTSIAPTYAGNATVGGAYDTYKQLSVNKLLDMYLNYKKYFKNIYSTIDLTAGYSYQDYITDIPASTTYYTIQTTPTVSLADSEESVLLSYYARVDLYLP